MVHVKAKQNKPANKQIKQIKQAKLKPYQSKQVEHQKLKASFGWVSGVQLREPRKSTKQSKSKQANKVNLKTKQARKLASEQANG